MDVREEIKGLFKFTGCAASEDVVDACAELCTKYGLSAEDVTDHWSAFTITHNNAPLTLDNVMLMERKELAAHRRAPEKPVISSETPLSHGDAGAENEDFAVKGSKRLRSPELSVDPKRFQLTPETLETTEPEYVPERPYTDRTDAGAVLQTFGQIPLSINHQDVSVLLYGNRLPQKFLYLYNSIKQISALFNAFIETVAGRIFKKHSISPPEPTGQSMSDAILYGRVRAENDGEKLSAGGVRLECPLDFNGGRSVSLNISQTRSFSLIPGEVVAVHGSMLCGNSFMAQEIYDDAMPDFCSENPRWTGDMQIVVAAGPFTICNDLSYQPLQDLLRLVVETRPDVLILMGPFVDCTQPGINLMQETFEAHFENLIRDVMSCLTGMETKVVVVPSQNDAHHHPIYPSPPYELRQKYPNLICASDPCIIDVNGLMIGLTNVDVLFHLTAQEISRKSSIADRMSRLASHVLKQGSFYPLYPPPKGVGIDFEMFLTGCAMEVAPHVLVLPSALRCFAKNVERCLVVNPERLVKNYVGGTYAVINVAPAERPGPMIDYLSCQIKKI